MPPPLTVGLVDQMLNLSKNGIKLLSISLCSRYRTCLDISQIFIQSVKLTKNPYMFDL